MDVNQGLDRGELTPAAVTRADPFALAQLLGSLSQHDMARLDATQLEAVAIAGERITAAVQARQSLAVDLLADRVEAELEQSGSQHSRLVAAGGADVHGLVASRLAPSLHSATRTAQRRVERDRRLVRLAESTFECHWQGDLERFRTDVIVDGARAVGPEHLPAFEALVLETSVDEETGVVELVSDRVRQMSRSELARRAARIARDLDPHANQRARASAEGCRRIMVRPDSQVPGMARWSVHLPSATSQRVLAAVDALAAQRCQANPGVPVDALRVDALADLVLGSADLTTVVELVVPVAPAQPSERVDDETRPWQGRASRTGSGPDAGPEPVVRWLLPAVLDDVRHGALVPAEIADLLGRVDTLVRLARLDPDGSIVQDPSSYRPSASTRRRVRSRDGVCRFPGCHTPARRTDLDHVDEHPRGPTDHGNLICLCRTHHLFRHHGGWRPSLDRDGTVTWTAPDGRAWVTHPQTADMLDALGLAPHDEQMAADLRRGWFPGLPPGMSLADLALAEAALPDDPPESTALPTPPADWAGLDALLGVTLHDSTERLKPSETARATTRPWMVIRLSMTDPLALAA